jgi:amino acid adenylation domain-containing protein
MNGWNDEMIEFPQCCLHEMFESQAERTPDTIALLFENEGESFWLSYGELNLRSDQLASYLNGLGVRPDCRVAVLMARSLDMVVALLGVVKAGGAYLALDPVYPAQRLSFMLDDSGAAVLLTTSDMGKKLPEHRAVSVNVDTERHLIEQTSGERSWASPSPYNLAYLIFTSGSTGRPKGVAIEHRSAVNFLTWATNAFSRNELSCLLASTSISFDLSVFELFAPLSVGGSVLLAENAFHLGTLAEADRVSLINTVPSAMTELLRLKALGAGVLTVNLAGEPLTNALAQQVYAASTATRVVNLYGPTEYTTYTTTHEVERHAQHEPTIGRPIAQTEVHILDERMSKVGDGVIGEIYIGGAGLARAYLNRPDLTAERFVPDAFGRSTGKRVYRTGDTGRCRLDGQVEYLGRTDQQVKIRGFRIELGEIESVLASHPGIETAVVVATKDRNGEPHEHNNHIRRLVAYVRPARDLPLASNELRDYLQAKLPEYMVPSVFVYVEQFPLTPNGKIDRNALLAPKWEGTAQSSRTPESSTEKLLRDIWAQVLKAEHIGVNDNFFQLGGDSILSIQVVARANRAGLNLIPQQLFQNPTIGQLALVADQSMTAQPDHGQAAFKAPTAAARLQNRTPGIYGPSDFPQIEISQSDLDDLVIGSGRKVIEDIYRLTPLQEGMVFHTLTAPRSGIYINQHRYTLQGDVDIMALKAAYRQVIKRHQILRTAFSLTSSGQMFQVVYSDARLSWTQYDWRDEPLTVQQEDMEEILRQDRERGFDLSKPPLMGMILIRQGPDVYQLIWTFHMLLLDGWSFQVLLKEVLAVYDAVSAGGTVELGPPASYADYIEWLQKQDRQEAEAYWRSTLAGFRAPTPLANNRLPIGAVDRREEDYRERSIYLDQEETAALKSFASRHELTVNTLVQGVWALLLARWSGGNDVVFGSVVSGRPADLPGVESTVGLFVNTIPVRVRISPASSLLPWLKALQNQQAEARRFEFCSLVDIRRWSGLLHGESVFESLLVFQNIPVDMSVLEPSRRLRLVDISNAERTNYPLSVTIRPGSRWHMRVAYDNRRFDESRIDMIVEQIQGLLLRVTSDSEATLASLSSSTQTERSALIDEFNLSLEEV